MHRRWWWFVAAWAVTLFGGLVLGEGGDSATQRMPTATNMAASFLLAAAACTAAVSGRDGPGRRVRALIAAGMVCGLLGDLALAGFLGPLSSTLVGMVLFGVGHLFYIAALLSLSRHLRLTNRRAWGGALAFWWLVALVGWYAVVWRGSTPGLLHGVALPYALLLATTAAAGLAAAMQHRPAWPVAVGAALFLISDLILAGRLFSGLSLPHIGDLIWLTYSPGQALIVFGMIALTTASTSAEEG